MARRCNHERCKGGRSKPNMIAMKNLKDFCESHNMDFNKLDEEWLQAEKESSL
jgi:putative transcriptional regulator